MPKDFCKKSCKLVDEFHRKTMNQEIEWMLYFDYTTGEIIYCWKGKSGESGGNFNRINFQDKNIASIHNHPSGYYSFLSPENFDILENDYEDFEIICSTNAFWIVEFKGAVEKQLREDFQTDISIEFSKLENEIKN